MYPWARGLKVDDIVSYYDEVKFEDWTHAETGAGPQGPAPGI